MKIKKSSVINIVNRYNVNGNIGIKVIERKDTYTAEEMDLAFNQGKIQALSDAISILDTEEDFNGKDVKMMLAMMLGHLAG